MKDVLTVVSPAKLENKILFPGTKIQILSPGKENLKLVEKGTYAVVNDFEFLGRKFKGGEVLRIHEREDN